MRSLYVVGIEGSVELQENDTVALDRRLRSAIVAWSRGLDSEASQDGSGIGRPCFVGADACSDERGKARPEGGVGEGFERVFEHATEAVDVISRVARSAGHSLGRHVPEAAWRARFSNPPSRPEVAEDRGSERTEQDIGRFDVVVHPAG